MVTEFWALDLGLYKLVTANVAARRISIFVQLACTKAFQRPIRPETHYDVCFQDDKRVKKLGERVLSDFHNGLLVKVLITRGENGYYCSHLVLLGVYCVL